jgi:hypothetical protein
MSIGSELGDSKASVNVDKDQLSSATGATGSFDHHLERSLSQFRSVEQAQARRLSES